MTREDHGVLIPTAKTAAPRPYMRQTRKSLAFTLSLATLAFTMALPSAASTTFPPIVKSRWGVSVLMKGDADGCTLCHQDDNGGYGTATRPFGKTMLKLHVIGKTPESLPNALDYDKSHAIDSDGDSIGDYQELAVDHTNPNDPKSFVLPPPPPDGGSEGGAGGATSSNDEGGQPNAVEPPPYEPPPADDLPPPFEHGCALAPSSTHDGLVAFVALATALATRRRRRAR